MKNIKSVTTLLFSTLCYCTTFSQENFKHDVGVIVSTAQYGKIGVDYRLYLNEHWKFKVGAMYGSQYSYPFAKDEVSTVNDSLITFRTFQSHSNYGFLKIGAERRLKTSMFSITADLLLGYENRKYGYSNSYTELDSNGVWIQQTGFYSLQGNYQGDDTTRSRITQHYFSPGLAIGAMMDIPIKSRFVLSLGITGNFRTRVHLASTNVFDPYNEFTNPSGFIFDFDMVVSAGIRYRFGKNSN